jgi:hypothetical protein
MATSPYLALVTGIVAFLNRSAPAGYMYIYLNS